jgi:ketosteroid isomerase-like protein
MGGVLVVLAVAVSACGGSSGSSASDEELQRKADSYAISLIERDFHQSLAQKDIDRLMALFSPNATFTFGPGQTATAKKQIRSTWLKSSVFKRTNDWLSDHPAYKLRVTVNGDRGTLHFECHFIDIKSRKVAAVTAADIDVARIDGRWLITKLVGGTAELSA